MGRLHNARVIVRNAAIELERLTGMRSKFVETLGEIDAAIQLGMNDEEFRSCYARPVNTPGYDLLHNGMRYQVKALRYSPKRCKFTTDINPEGFDVLLAIIYAEDFSIRDLYRLTREQAVSNARDSRGRIRFADIESFRVTPWTERTS
jgi:hypothetical protein